MNGIDLCDVYQSPDNCSIIISAKRTDITEGIFQDTDYIEGTENDICQKLSELKKRYQTDEQDILMLQQILMRQNIKLFFNPKTQNI